MPKEAEAHAALTRARQHDTHGEAAAAIPEYERSLALGLAGEERCIALAGLGVALRIVGRVDEAVRVLRAAAQQFPEHAPLRESLDLALGDGARGATVVPLEALAAAPAVAPDWRARVAAATRDEFARAHPTPFLVEVGRRLGTQLADDLFETQTLAGARVADLAREEAPPPVAPLVIAVPPAGRQVPSAISLGRLPSNDVVIRDSCVSKIHAFFRAGGDGRWALSDAGSHNGTWIGNRRLEPNGEALPVGAGDVLSFGRAAFYFLDGKGLWERLR